MFKKKKNVSSFPESYDFRPIPVTDNKYLCQINGTHVVYVLDDRSILVRWKNKRTAIYIIIEGDRPYIFWLANVIYYRKRALLVRNTRTYTREFAYLLLALCKNARTRVFTYILWTIKHVFGAERWAILFGFP